MSWNACSKKLYNICQINNSVCMCRASEEENKAYTYPIRIDELFIDQNEDERDLSDPGWSHVMHDGL